jgi:hypothetical protein
MPVKQTFRTGRRNVNVVAKSSGMVTMKLPRNSTLRIKKA